MGNVFKDPEFLNDKYRYNVANLLLASETKKVCTDDVNYFLVQSDKNKPVWVWNKDNLDNATLDKLVSELKKYFNKDDVVQFTLKKEVFDKVLEVYKDYVLDGYFKEKGYYLCMRAYTCENPVKPNNLVGTLRRPNVSELKTLAEFTLQDAKDTLREEYSSKFTLDDALKEANKHLNNPNFYVLEVNGKVVAQGGFGALNDGVARVSYVFTDPAYRGYGYAGSLVYQLCLKALEEGYLPLLYADGDYYPSNRAYQKVGFVFQGDLYNVKLGNNNVKKLSR